jgi:uncharacterized protein
MLARNLTPSILAALGDTPVVFVAGARQSGKTTLVRELAGGVHPARYLTLDDLAVLAAARRDPEGFLAGLVGPVVLDEVQRVPELLLAIKAEVDRRRVPGRFLLTGSANFLALPKVADSLVGRMEVCTLWPFSQGELAGYREVFLDRMFSDRISEVAVPATSRTELVRRILCGGFPEIQGRVRAERRAAWFRAYLTTLVQRDVRDLAAIEGLAQLPQLLALVAARTGSTTNLADLSRTAALPQTTLKRYLALIEALFLVHRVPAWSTNLTSRQVKAPKLYLVDSGLAAHLLGLDEVRLEADTGLFGGLLESFVVGELSRQVTWSPLHPRLHHFRTHEGREVDMVLEDVHGRLLGIEVKATASPTARDVAGLKALAELAGDRFVRGILLYTGRESVPLARNIHAMPVSTLWSHGAQV